MTAINRLTENLKINPTDSFPLWDASSGRTRRITGETLLSYITEKNIAEDGVSFDSDGNLIITLNDGSTINAGQLPKSVLTVDGVKTDDVETGKFLRSHQNPQPMNEDNPEVVVIDVDTTYEPWRAETTVAILLDVVSIDSIDKCGIEYRIDFKESEIANVSFHLHPIHSDGAHIKITPINMAAKSKPVYVFGNFPSGKSFSYNVTHSTVFSEYDGEWRTEESSQLLSVTSGVMREDGNEKKPIHGIAIKPDSNLTQEITEDGVLVLGIEPTNGDSPGGDYIQKHTNAELNKLFVAYQGRYGENRVYYPVSLLQDANGLTQLEFTGSMLFKYKDKNSGVLGDNILELMSGLVSLHKKIEALKGMKVIGEFSVSDSDDNLACYFNHLESLFKVFYPTVIEQQLTLSKDTGTVLNVNRGEIKVWSNGAIEVPNYKSFSDNDLITKKYAKILIAEDKKKGEWIGGVLKDTISDDGNPEDDFLCDNPKHYLDYMKTSFQGDYALTVIQGDALISSEIVIHLHPSSGMNSTVFQIVTNDGKTTTKTVRMGETWRFFLRTGTLPYYERIDDGTSSGSELTFRDAAVLDKVESIGFENADKITEIKPAEDYKYRVVDIPTRLYTSGTVNVFLDSSKPVGSFQIDNVCNYNSDYPELVIMLYVDNTVTSLGGFRVPYGLGATVKYNLDNKEVSNYKNGYWTWNLSVIDWSILKRASQAGIIDQVDVSGFDAEPLVKPVQKRFTNTDLITIPLTLPDGFSVMVRQVIVKRSSGVELDMGFTYKYDGTILQVHLNETGTGILLAGIVKDEI